MAYYQTRDVGAEVSIGLQWQWTHVTMAVELFALYLRGLRLSETGTPETGDRSSTGTDLRILPTLYLGSSFS